MDGHQLRAEGLLMSGCG